MPITNALDAANKCYVFVWEPGMSKEFNMAQEFEIALQTYTETLEVIAKLLSSISERL